jgi:acyl carrier protein
MTPDTTVVPDIDTLRELVADVLDIPAAEIGDDTDFVNELGLDSLMALEVMVVLEQRFGVTLEDSELEHLSSLASAHRLMAKKLQETS